MQDSTTRELTFDEYLSHYAADFYEYAERDLIKMAPVSLEHHTLTHYLWLLLETFFQFRPLGKIIAAPFVMKLPESGREPDLQIILTANLDRLTSTYVDGPADICIEVVSPESTVRDYGKKFDEYERGRVNEYWIIDLLRRESYFHRLREIDNTLRYAHINTDDQGYYRTPLLPQFALHIPTLWQETLPGPVSVVETIRAMLE
jgi:Uma2 family endonuclease